MRMTTPTAALVAAALALWLEVPSTTQMQALLYSPIATMPPNLRPHESHFLMQP